VRIPVFVSCPTSLSPEQDAARKLILGRLRALNLEPRALGRSDYPTDYPLREVYVIANHCSGGVILGFEQFRSDSGINKPGAPQEKKVSHNTSHPTPWNQLEAGILFGLGLALLIFKEDQISGGVFDPGVTDVFVHAMPPANPTAGQKNQLKDVFMAWQRKVRDHYYEYKPR
jgi:hypothetical protein